MTPFLRVSESDARFGVYMCGCKLRDARVCFEKGFSSSRVGGEGVSLVKMIAVR